ncbi:hypothetical protein ACJX0J_042377 [Zea mays]
MTMMNLFLQTKRIHYDLVTSGISFFIGTHNHAICCTIFFFQKMQIIDINHFCAIVTDFDDQIEQRGVQGLQLVFHLYFNRQFTYSKIVNLNVYATLIDFNIGESSDFAGSKPLKVHCLIFHYMWHRNFHLKRCIGSPVVLFGDSYGGSKSRLRLHYFNANLHSNFIFLGVYFTAFSLHFLTGP